MKRRNTLETTETARPVVELVGDFYRSVTRAEARQLNRGQICWGPVRYISSQYRSLDLDSYNPGDERLNQYSLTTHEPDDLSIFDHFPVHELRLQHDEALLVDRAKRRPVVVMSQRNEFWSMGGARLSERGLVCLPMYSFQHDDSREFRNRVRAQEYPWWLYLPEYRSLNEGFARIDRLQTIEELQLQPTQYALTDSALWFASEWLKYYLTGEIDELLFEYREETVRNLQGS